MTVLTIVWTRSDTKTAAVQCSNSCEVSVPQTFEAINLARKPCSSACPMHTQYAWGSLKMQD